MAPARAAGASAGRAQALASSEAASGTVGSVRAKDPRQQAPKSI